MAKGFDGSRGCRLVAAGAIGVAAVALAQSGGHRVMVIEDAGGQSVMHFTGPNMGDLRQPDYVRRDLPVFNDELGLDDVQRLVVDVLMDAYLNAFQMLWDKTMADAIPPMMGGFAGADPGPGGAAGEMGGLTIDGIMDEAVHEAGDVQEMDMDVEFEPGGVAIAIEARVPGDDPGTGGELADHMEMDDAGVQVWAGDGVEADGGPGVFIALKTPEGVEIPEALRKQLEEKAQAMAERIREQLEKMEAEGIDPLRGIPPADDTIEERRRQLDELREAIAKFTRAKEALRQDFVADVQGQLAPGQLERWPQLDMTLTRAKTLPQGRLDGERTDLVRIVEGLGLDDEQVEAVTEPLGAYESSLHQALLARNDYLKEAYTKLDETIQRGEFDKALSITDHATRLRVAVRSVNERFTETIAGSLGADGGAELRRRVLEASYPRAYRATAGRRAFDHALAVDGLDDDVRAAIDALEQAYEMELATANERIRRAIRRHQPDESRDAIEAIQSAMSGGQGQMTMTFGGGGEDNPIRQALKKRKELDERYIKQIESLLPAEEGDAAR